MSYKTTLVYVSSTVRVIPLKIDSNGILIEDVPAALITKEGMNSAYTRKWIREFSVAHGNNDLNLAIVDARIDSESEVKDISKEEFAAEKAADEKKFRRGSKEFVGWGKYKGNTADKDTYLRIVANKKDFSYVDALKQDGFNVHYLSTDVATIAQAKNRSIRAMVILDDVPELVLFNQSGMQRYQGKGSIYGAVEWLCEQTGKDLGSVLSLFTKVGLDDGRDEQRVIKAVLGESGLEVYTEFIRKVKQTYSIISDKAIEQIWASSKGRGQITPVGEFTCINGLVADIIRHPDMISNIRKNKIISLVRPEIVQRFKQSAELMLAASVVVFYGYGNMLINCDPIECVEDSKFITNSVDNRQVLPVGEAAAHTKTKSLKATDEEIDQRAQELAEQWDISGNTGDSMADLGALSLNDSIVRNALENSDDDTKKALIEKIKPDMFDPSVFSTAPGSKLELKSIHRPKGFGKAATSVVDKSEEEIGSRHTEVKLDTKPVVDEVVEQIEEVTPEPVVMEKIEPAKEMAVPEEVMPVPEEVVEEEVVPEEPAEEVVEEPVEEPVQKPILQREVVRAHTARKPVNIEKEREEFEAQVIAVTKPVGSVITENKGAGLVSRQMATPRIKKNYEPTKEELREVKDGFGRDASSLLSIEPISIKKSQKASLDKERERYLRTVDSMKDVSAVKKHNVGLAVLVLGIITLVAGCIFSMGTKDTSAVTPAAEQIAQSEAIIAQLNKEIEDRTNIERLVTDVFAKYMPYMYAAEEAHSTGLRITDMNIVGDKSLRINGVSMNIISYQEFQEKLQSIDDSMEVVLADSSSTGDETMFTIEIQPKEE